VRHRVDPAALLVAVFAVGVGPLLQSGEWSYVNTITAGVVLLVVLAFSWPSQALPPTESLSRAVRAAYSAVCAFVVAIMAAWPAQELLRHNLPTVDDCHRAAAKTVLASIHAHECEVVRTEDIAGAGTQLGLIIGLMAFVGFYVALYEINRPKKLPRATVS
jgi:hypothetical protein